VGCLYGHFFTMFFIEYGMFFIEYGMFFIEYGQRNPG
jgi:hypothetical protein